MPAPTATWAIDATGLVLTALWSEGVEGSLNSDATLSVGGVSVTATGLTLTDSTHTTWAIPAAVAAGVTVTASLPTNAVNALGDSTPNATITAAACTNSSVVFGGWSGPGGNMLTQSCTIESASFSQSTTSAGRKATWANYRTGVRCAIQGVRGGSSIAFMREQNARVYTGFFPPTLTFTPGTLYRIKSITGGGASMSGVYLEVDGTPWEESGHGGPLSVQLRETTGVVNQ